MDRGVVDMENKGDLKKEIQKLEMEIGEIKRGIPPHSARFEINRLLEEKRQEWNERGIFFDKNLEDQGGINMSIERLVLVFAGCFILISLVLSQLLSPYWLFFTAFVGANLLQSAFTGFCPLAKILKAFGARPSCEMFKC